MSTHAYPDSEPSVLADFDTGRVLDELSFGIIVLDRQLCAIYANVIAQSLLGLHLPSMRGRPVRDFLDLESLDLKITPVCSQTCGGYFLLELSGVPSLEAQERSAP